MLMTWARFLAWLRGLFYPTIAVAPGYTGYGGATITRRVDGSGALWVACCAKSSAGRFGFYAFRNGESVPLQPFCSGRGTIHDDGVWIAWEGSTKYEGNLPGWMPKATGGGRPAVAIPPAGALAALYTGVYAPADFDTPAETAQRVQKQLDAIQELTELLKAAGVLV
jgi:hypothetical protein